MRVCIIGLGITAEVNISKVYLLFVTLQNFHTCWRRNFMLNHLSIFIAY
jgi:hypothetical protein